MVFKGELPKFVAVGSNGRTSKNTKTHAAMSFENCTQVLYERSSCNEYVSTQLTITCSKLTKETLEQDVKYVQS